MARKRLDQGDLADALNVSRAAVSRRLTGVVDFTVTELHIVARVLGVPVSALLPTEQEVA